MPNSQATSRKQACQFCRQRKKKCDGKAPSCTYCMKLRVPCYYAPLQTRTADDLEPWTLQAPAPQAAWASLPMQLPQQPATNVQQPQQPQQQHQFMQQGMHDGLQNPLWSTISAQPTRGTPISMADNDALLPLGQDALMAMFAQDAHPLSDPLMPDVDWPAATQGPTNTPASSRSSIPFTTSSNRSSIIETTLPSPPPEKSSLPSGQDMEGLFDVFFARYHTLLPSIHQASFRQQWSQGLIDLDSDPLPWAIASVAAKSQADQTQQGLCSAWLDKSKTLFDASACSLKHPQHTLQASVWIIFQCYVLAEMPEMWLWMGKACRLATLLGFDRVDAARGLSPFAPALSNELEREERRQTVWALYMLDRFLSCLCGWPLAIDDRAFKVNFPRDDDHFQAGDLGGRSDPFSLDMSEPFGPYQSQMGSPDLRPGQLITRLAVVLGRIITHNNHMHPESDKASYAAEFAALEHALSCFRIARAHGGDDIFSIPDGDLNRVVWFEVLLQMCTMLLYHSTVATVPGDGGTGFSHASAISSIPLSPNSSNRSPGFLRCQQAMNSIVALVCDASSRSVKPLLNPFIVPAYFLCSRFLAIGWHERQDAGSRRSLDLMLMLLGRCSELWGPLAIKYRARVLHDLQQDSSWAQRARVGDGNYLGEERGV